MILDVGAVSDLIISAGKRSQHRYGRLEMELRTWIRCRGSRGSGGNRHQRLITAVMQILETGLVYDIRAHDLGVADLHGVLGRNRVVSLGRKRKHPDSLIVLAVSEVLVTDGQGVARGELKIEPRTKIDSSLLTRNRLGEVGGTWAGVRDRRHDRVHNVGVVDVPDLRGKKERRPLAHRSAEAAIE